MIRNNLCSCKYTPNYLKWSQNDCKPSSDNPSLTCGVKLVILDSHPLIRFQSANVLGLV